MIDSIKLTGDIDIILNGIDYVGDVGYTYKMKKYEDTIVALPISIINTPHNLKEFRATLNDLYYIKRQLISLSIQLKTVKEKQHLDHSLTDSFSTPKLRCAAGDEEVETNIFYSPKTKSIKIAKSSEEEAE